MGKKLKELTLKDSFLFGAVMRNEENCRTLLELITDLSIERVEISSEKRLIYHPEYKGVRLDVYAKDEHHTCYNVEMQVARRPALGRRARFYRSQMDMELLLKGKDYSELPDSYVIFICDFDPFGGNYYRYTFQNLCLEDNRQKLQEGCHYIFLNAVGKKPELVSEGLVRFLRYIHADLLESEKDFQDAFIKQLQDTVKQIKGSREMEERYMVFEEMLRDERKSGREEGKAEGKAESILDLLRIKGNLPEGLEEQIRSQKNVEILTGWLLLAAAAGSVQEFEEKIR